jgi:TPR repeat protein
MVNRYALFMIGCLVIPCLYSPAFAQPAVCDFLASSPLDSTRPPGVQGNEFEAIVVEKALPACKQALIEQSTNARFKFQLARVLKKAKQDINVQITLLTDAAKAGHWAAADALGTIYLNGDGVPRDAALAYNWYLRAAEGNFSSSMRQVALMLKAGYGVSQDIVASTRWAQRAALSGDARSMADFGEALHNGDGVTENSSEAALWLQKSAEAGDPNGMRLWGDALENGWGVNRDIVRGAAWRRKAADTGDPQSMYEYGRKLRYANDAREGFEWTRRAAEQKYAPAMFRLARLFEKGEGIEQDTNAANEWYKKATEYGNVMAMISLGLNLERGLGVERNLKLAAAMFCSAARAGSADGAAHFARIEIMITAKKGTPIIILHADTPCQKTFELSPSKQGEIQIPPEIYDVVLKRYFGGDGKLPLVAMEVAGKLYRNELTCPRQIGPV